MFWVAGSNLLIVSGLVEIKFRFGSLYIKL